MKRKIAICLIFSLLLALLCACGGNQPGNQMSAEESSQGTEAVSDPEESSSPAESEESEVSEMEIPQTGWTEAVPAEYFEFTATKNMFDNLIANGDIPPLIIVSATFYNENSSTDFGSSIEEFRAFHQDFENHLMPAVEGRFPL